MPYNVYNLAKKCLKYFLNLSCTMNHLNHQTLRSNKLHRSEKKQLYVLTVSCWIKALGPWYQNRLQLQEMGCLKTQITSLRAAHVA